MSNKYTEPESPVVSLKNESSRQRWELFHRAIAHAKEANDASLSDEEGSAVESSSAAPLLTVVR
jgi:hypothetical protein